MVKEEIISALLEFRKERDWEQFHDVRNLISALSIEVHELMELFLWATDRDLADRIEQNSEAIRQEIADLVILLTYLCHDLHINLNDAVSDKLIVNRNKYPVDKAKGVATKYDSSNKPGAGRDRPTCVACSLARACPTPGVPAGAEAMVVEDFLSRPVAGSVAT